VHLPEADDWIGLTTDVLTIDEPSRWAVRPDCGAVVVFAGTVRDHAEGRDGVTGLEYEAYDAHVLPRLQAIIDEARRQWPTIGRVALLHRTGPLALGDVSVIVAVSAPHRGEAFDAAEWAIDTLKVTVPIWKRESWEAGSAWGTDAHPVENVADRPSRVG
jgi:molybdopterin synthase catalytic subunit